MSLPIVVINGDQFSIVPHPADPGEVSQDKKILQDDLAPIITKVWEQIHQEQRIGGIDTFMNGRVLMNVVDDPVQAAACFCAAANLGLPEALFAFARCCLEGVGVQQNKQAAEKAFSALQKKCVAIVGENTQRKPIERMWALYLHSLNFYYTMQKPSALRQFNSVLWIINKHGIQSPATVTATNNWIEKIQKELGK